MRKLGWFLVLLLSANMHLLSYAGQLDGSDVLHVKANRRGEETNLMVNFRLSLIEKALLASQQRFVIEDCEVPKYPTSDARYALLVNDGVRCDVLATASGAGFTKELLLVPVPIYLGGGGYRIFLGNRSTIERATLVKDLDGLRRLRIGSGTFWSDSDIMSDNGLNVMRANYSSLFSMLEADRFDLLSRSIYEINGEKHLMSKYPGIVVEPRILLHYPSDLFFYVSTSRPELQKALTVGMIRLYCSGELQRHINEHPSTRGVMAEYKVGTRIVIELENQHLNTMEAKALADFVPANSGQKPNFAVTGRSRNSATDFRKLMPICNASH